MENNDLQKLPSSAKQVLEGLNSQQEEAVTHQEGPLLIVAGAGTGKTTVITRRIAWLIWQKLATPSQILALTFTDKAAQEMEFRVDQLVPYGYVDTQISTFHAFGDRVLHDNAVSLGLPSDFKVLNREEQAIFLKDNLGALELKNFAPLSNPTGHISELLSYFSRLKDEDIAPEHYYGYVKRKKEKGKSDEEKKELEKHAELARAYGNYQKLMLEAGNLDFGDQITLTLKLFREHPDVLKKYQEQFKYILVDEFQDTNYAQNELVKLLAGKGGNITVVGDDDQSIYRFRGAAISNILDFKEYYKSAKIITLTKNYRSTRQILDAAYKLITHNNPDRLEVRAKISKKLESETNGNFPEHLHQDTLTSEAHRVAEIIGGKIKTGKYGPSDFAILVRKNSQAIAFSQALGQAGIPFKFSGSRGLFSRPEVRLVIQFLKALTDPTDSLALYYLFTSELYEMAPQEALKLTNIAKQRHKNLEEICCNEETLWGLEISATSKEIIKKVCANLEKFRKDLKELTCGQLVYRFLKETGFLEGLILKSEKQTEAAVRVENLAKFFSKIQEFEKLAQDKSTINFINHLDLLIEAGDDPATAELDPDIDAVSILTVHKAKGLEFPVVFLVNLVSDSFPSRKRSEGFSIPEELIKERLPEGDWHIQEERRLFYVGMTRAKQELYLTSAEDYGGKRLRKVSPFVVEALEEVRLAREKFKLSPKEYIEKFSKRQEAVALPKRFKEGERLVLTPHQIDDYLSCPKKFEYIHVLGIPILAHHPVVYGSAIHKAIEDYFKKKLAEVKVSVEDLYKIFEQNWRSEGFLSRDHEEKRFKSGKEALSKFFLKEEKEGRRPSEVEASFGVKLDEPNVKIKGRYDAIYDGNAHTEIRDFKTSNVDEQGKADKAAKGNRQLSLYALSYKLAKGRLPEEVSLYYVDTGIIGKAKKTEADIEKTLGEIKAVDEGLRKNDFEAKPSWNECSRCAYREICPYTLSG